MNPLYIIAIINVIALIWAVRSWKKGINEKWIQNFLTISSQIIGAAESIYLKKHVKGMGDCPESMSHIIESNSKLKLLLRMQNIESNELFKLAENLRNSADSGVSYRENFDAFEAKAQETLTAAWASTKGLL
mgnify:CR=1 FL=1